jgi:hypothetical protein
LTSPSKARFVAFKQLGPQSFHSKVTFKPRKGRSEWLFQLESVVHSRESIAQPIYVGGFWPQSNRAIPAPAAPQCRELGQEPRAGAAGPPREWRASPREYCLVQEASK